MYYINETRISCFRVIKAVLDELYEKLPDPRTKDKIIGRKLEELREDYDSLSMGEMPKYTDLYKRFAYLYCYVPAHANIVYRLIDENLGNLFDADVKVACLGGGPGSDLLGIIKFMVEQNKSAKLECGMFDKEDIWRDSWKSMCDNIKIPKRVHLTFAASSSFNLLDVTKSDSWIKYSPLWDADLFTMSYFVSEVCSIEKHPETFFKHLFEKAKKGSYFLLVDNISCGSHYWFDYQVDGHNKPRRMGLLKRIGGSDRRVDKMEIDEEKTDLGLFYKKFKDISIPKTLGENKPFVYRIYRKM
jgi:hypothetical protein